MDAANGPVTNSMSVESRQEFITMVVRTAAKLGCYVLWTEEMNDGSS